MASLSHVGSGARQPIPVYPRRRLLLGFGATLASVSMHAWCAPLTLPPPPGIGMLKVRATPVRYTGAARVLGSGKHFDFARVGNRWYQAAGDHAAIDSKTTDSQDGRQEILSVNFVANDWRQETPYYLRDPAPDSKVQIAVPDDGAIAARNNEIWSFVSERVDSRTTAVVTADARARYGSNIVVQEMDAIGAIDVTTKQWRKTLSPRPHIMRGDRLWRVYYDSHTDCFYGACDAGGLAFLVIDGARGNDISSYAGANTPVTLGNITAHVAGMAVDGRNAYIYDHQTAKLYRISLDAIHDRNGGPTFVVDIPGEGGGTGESAIKIAFHPDARAVIIAANQLHAYEVDTGKITNWPRPDGFTNGAGRYVPTSTIFFDPDTRDIISIGTIDWDAGQNPGVYWRLKITAA
jgi:hypothetical protein